MITVSDGTGDLSVALPRECTGACTGTGTDTSACIGAGIGTGTGTGTGTSRAKRCIVAAGGFSGCMDDPSGGNHKFYLEYVVARLAAFSNVWWSMANEYDFSTLSPTPSCRRTGSTQCARRMLSSVCYLHCSNSVHTPLARCCML